MSNSVFCLDSTEAIRFRAVVFRVEQLLEQTTLKKLRESLTWLPTALSSLYTDEMERRSEDGADKLDLARISLAFLSNANRPLTFNELELSVSISLGEDPNDSEARVPIDIILSTCSNMVIVDYMEETVKVAHWTIRKFTQEILQGYGVVQSALEAVYPPNQIVRLFVGDDALLGLVGKVFDTAFLGCFEQKLSMLLKTYANRLKEEAKSPSQESAAILTGAWTRQIAERLSLIVRPLNSQDQEGGVIAGNSKENEVPVLGALIKSAEAINFEIDQNKVEEKTGDPASSVTTIDFMGLREFMLATGPFADLKAALAHQVDINSLASSETASLEESTKGNQSKDAGRDRSAQLWDKMHALMIGAPAIPHALVMPRNWTTTRWRQLRYRMLRSRVLNWLDVCKEVFFRRIPDERLEMKHFQWTCVSHRSHYKVPTIQLSLYHYRAAGVSSMKV